jgi:transposase-like protein
VFSLIEPDSFKEEGTREVLDVSVSHSEHEVHWRTFLKGLMVRGLTGAQLILSAMPTAA